MTDQPKPSAEALVAADAFLKGRGWLRGGVMALQLAEAFDAFAARETGALKHTLELWDQECGGRSPRAFVELLTAAAHALRSYQYGNASPDLAQEIADRIDAVLPAGMMLGQPITEAERARISKDGP